MSYIESEFYWKKTREIIKCQQKSRQIFKTKTNFDEKKMFDIFCRNFQVHQVHIFCDKQSEIKEFYRKWCLCLSSDPSRVQLRKTVSWCLQCLSQKERPAGPVLLSALASATQRPRPLYFLVRPQQPQPLFEDLPRPAM